jgi:3-phenylpropionate/cinnamic acid dioxygenase small subunit
MSDGTRAIENLLAEYAERIDAGDFSGVADLFADAELGSVGVPGALRGREQIQRLYESTTRCYEDGTPKTRHMITNVWVEVDEEAGTARSRSSFTVVQAAPGFSLQPVAVGRYEDRFERRDGRWRFSERRFKTELWGDTSHHLLDAGQALGPGAS